MIDQDTIETGDGDLVGKPPKEKTDPQAATTSDAVEWIFDKLDSGELGIGSEIEIVRGIHIPAQDQDVTFGVTELYGGDALATSRGFFCGVVRDPAGSLCAMLAKHNPLAHEAGDNRNEPVVVLDGLTTSCTITIL